MTSVALLLFLVVALSVVAINVVVWRRLPPDMRQPLIVYEASYFVTYCIGGIWIGLTNGDVLVGYFRDRMYIPMVASFGYLYWAILLAPLLLPALMAAVLARPRPARTPSTVSHVPTRWQFVSVAATLSGYAVFRIFHSGFGVVEAFSNMGALYGDTASIVEKRLELFDPGTTAAFGIVYSGLPALCHVALFKAADAGRSWRAIAIGIVAVTLGLSVATFQIAPAAVCVAALVLSAGHLRLLRMSRSRALGYGVVFLLLLQGLNGWKFADWTFVENINHIVFRMPAAFPYYLDCFPGTIPFLGADWLGALTGRGADPGSPFVVARFIWADAINGSAMAAPAHVQGYAEAGLVYSLICVATVGALIALVALLHRKSKEGALWHALYMQSLVGLYYSTQTSFRGAMWHSYGMYWSCLALLLVGAISLKPVLTRTIAPRVLRQPARGIRTATAAGIR